MAKYVSANTAPIAIDIGNMAIDTSVSQVLCGDNWNENIIIYVLQN